MSDRRGRFFVVEGPDGSGKTTQRDMLVERLIREGGQAIGVHEPGGTEIGQALRRVILDRDLGRTATTNLMLFTADRLEQWEQVIKLALDAGIDVVTDRHWWSSAAYQGHAEGLGIDEVRDITAQFLPPEYMRPTLAILLATDNTGAVQDRMNARGGPAADTFESRGADFQLETVRGYVLSAVHIGHVAVVESNASREEVHEDIWREVQSLTVS